MQNFMYIYIKRNLKNKKQHSEFMPFRLNQKNDATKSFSALLKKISLKKEEILQLVD